jgi:hypothetical protein
VRKRFALAPNSLTREAERMTGLFDEADRAADAMRKRPGFSEADLALVFRQLQKRWQPGLEDAEARELFELWRDHHTARRGVERQALIDRMPALLRQRDALLDQMPDMTAPEQVAASLRVQSIANEIAESCARIQGRDEPPPAGDAASWV